MSIGAPSSGIIPYTGIVVVVVKEMQCVRACVRACMRACVRALLCAFASETVESVRALFFRFFFVFFE